MTDASTSVALAPIVSAIQPIITAVVTAMVGVGVTWFVALVHRWTGKELAQADQDKLRQAANDVAGGIFAGAEAGISSVSIKVGDPRLAGAVSKVEALAPGVMALTGVTPDAVAHLIVAEIGRLQAQSTATPAPAPK